MARLPLTFRIYRGRDLVRTETLTQDVVKIGKLSTSHLRLDDDSVSRMHAVVEVSGDEVNVIDLGSTHGTFVNGQKVNRSRVRDGDELTIGATRVVIGIGAPVEASAPLAPQATMIGVPAPAIPPPPTAPALPKVPAPLAAVPAPGDGFAPPPAPDALRVAARPLADPAFDAPDGARAIEVAAMFGPTVIDVVELRNPKAGKPTTLTLARVGIGALLAIVGLVFAIKGQVGAAALLLLSGTAIGTFGYIHLIEEKRSPHFLIGDDPNATFYAPSSGLPSPLFPLVRSTGHDYSLLFAAGMTGDVAVGADLIDLASLAQSGKARVCSDFANTYEYPIPASARCKVDYGENTFLVNSVVRARAVPKTGWRNRDWSAQLYTAMAGAAHLLLLLTVSAIPEDSKSLSLDLFGTDNRFVKFLIKPPDQKDEDIPEWLKKANDDDAGGKGQKHKGEEGKMGSKKSKKKEGLYGLKGPPDTKDPHLAKRLAEEAANNAGVLGLLKSNSGSHIASIFGRDSALGTDATDALGGLIGDQIGEAYGAGGLGLVGTGRGGGGTGEGTIGLGTLGTIGKGGGGGGGAGYGRGMGRLGGRKARAPDVVPGVAQVRGSLDKEIIRRIIRRHINEVKYCYEKELVAHPDMHGRVQVQFTISGTGQVIQSVVQQSTLGNTTVEQCVAQAVMRWPFPKPMGGGIVIVGYPFVLQAAGGEGE